MMAHVEARDLTVRYPVFTSSSRSLKNQILSRTTGGRIAGHSSRALEVQALDNVSFTFEAGDRIALIGHNGSGKSTLLRVLAGIYCPSGGSIKVTGQVAALFDQSFGMDPDATGYENILLRGLYLGMSRGEIEEQMDEIADFSELGEFLDMPLRTYSAGMAARLAFAISSSVKADILIIDEAVGAGDAAFTDKARKRLDRLIDRSPIVVFASHDKSSVDLLCTRGLVLQQGRLLFDGPLEQAYLRYEGLIGARITS